MIVDRVYRYGCTRDPADMRLALQVLGQAYLYREDLRRVYNDASRRLRELARDPDDHAHVVAGVYDAKLARIRAARGARGGLLDAGTYWLVEAAVEQAAKASGLDPIRAEPWEQTGRIGAMVQSVDKFPADSWTHRRVSLVPSGSRPNHMLLTIRIGPAGADRLITWPMQMHRPLPPGGVVKRVAVQRTRSGHRYRWEVLITVRFDDARETRDPGAHGVVGVDVGWRLEAGGALRVATHDEG